MTGHDTLVHSGQSGYDRVILDYLRCNVEPANTYSIGVIGSGIGVWGWSSGAAAPPGGYPVATYYDTNVLDGNSGLQDQAVANDVLVILSHESVGGGGLSTAGSNIINQQMAFKIAVRFNAGMDLWVNSGSTHSTYYDFLPPQQVTTAVPINGSAFCATTAGVAIGITAAHTSGFPTHNSFSAYSSSLTVCETDCGAGTTAISLCGKDILLGWDATATPFGAPCHACYSSFYEFFPTPAGFNLTNTSISMWRTLAGYLVSPSFAAIVPVGSIGTPLALTLGDDDEVTVPLSVGKFVGCTGSLWPGLSIISNGKVSEAPGNSLVAAPSVPTMLGDLQTAFYSQGDWDPSVGGTVWVEQSAGLTTVTWENVPSWGIPGSSNTFQMQFFPWGDVNIVWGVMEPSGANGGILVGYSPGGSSADPGATALGAAFPFLTCCVDKLPLTLAAVSRPIQPASGPPLDFVVTTSNIDAGAIIHLGVLGLQDFPVGISLNVFGIGPGDCNQYCSVEYVVAHAFSGAAPSSYTWTAVSIFPPAPSLLSFQFCVQALTLNPGFFSIDDRSSNGLRCVVGNQ